MQQFLRVNSIYQLTIRIPYFAQNQFQRVTQPVQPSNPTTMDGTS